MAPGGHTAPLPAGIAGDDFRAGFGTFDTALDRYGDETYTDLLVTALEVGYRHVDTSPQAGTEEVVAAGLRRAASTGAR